MTPMKSNGFHSINVDLNRRMCYNGKRVRASSPTPATRGATAPERYITAQVHSPTLSSIRSVTADTTTIPTRVSITCKRVITTTSMGLLRIGGKSNE